ncbi:hypothetical protein K3758_07610 [Sulfitobacter sp. W002]|uniref:hypothetical protein n=1 Tax=Sulfitobacter sp. W002 TaxID=2867024 RepID=UPI0021A4F909|nr:hypothetical protein [Sulfitobacter sp. W002]UWR31361.1 hypothetical protein K3758_07610 [Sulfitobacter sp. W002]
MADLADPAALIRSMAPEERRGFLYACDVMHSWAGQIEEKAPTLRGADLDIPLSLQMQNSARFAQGLADAMKRQASA